ncbi:MAG: hypothetical protein WAU60_06225 [Candidatus Competibacter denitrificans]|jgi:hypothetical protein
MVAKGDTYQDRMRRYDEATHSIASLATLIADLYDKGVLDSDGLRHAVAMIRERQAERAALLHPTKPTLLAEAA